LTGNEEILASGNKVVPVTELQIWTQRTVGSDERILIPMNKVQVQLVCTQCRRRRMAVSKHFCELRLNVIADISFVQSVGCN
jgi:hypothetical protein